MLRSCSNSKSSMSTRLFRRNTHCLPQCSKSKYWITVYRRHVQELSNTSQFWCEGEHVKDNSTLMSSKSCWAILKQQLKWLPKQHFKAPEVHVLLFIFRVNQFFWSVFQRDQWVTELKRFLLCIFEHSTHSLSLSARYSGHVVVRRVDTNIFF